MENVTFPLHWVAVCISEVAFHIFSLHTIEKVWVKAADSKAWDVTSLSNLQSDWGISPLFDSPTGDEKGLSSLHPFSDKQQLGSVDPIIATNLQVALSRPEESHDFLLVVCVEFRKWKHDIPLASQAIMRASA
jgi:hypothetical protein